MLIEKPPMPGMQVALVDGPIAIAGDLLGIGLDRAPEVGDPGVEIVDRLRLACPTRPPSRPGEQDRARTKEGLDVVVHLSERAPDDGRRAALPSEPGEGRAQIGDRDDPRFVAGDLRLVVAGAAILFPRGGVGRGRELADVDGGELGQQRLDVFVRRGEVTEKLEVCPS